MALHEQTADCVAHGTTVGRKTRISWVAGRFSLRGLKLLTVSTALTLTPCPLSRLCTGRLYPAP